MPPTQIRSATFSHHDGRLAGPNLNGAVPGGNAQSGETGSSSPVEELLLQGGHVLQTPPWGSRLGLQCQGGGHCCGWPVPPQQGKGEVVKDPGL